MPKTQRKSKAYLTDLNASVPNYTRYRWQQQKRVRQLYQSPVKEQHQQQHTFARIKEGKSDFCFQLTFDANESIAAANVDEFDEIGEKRRNSTRSFTLLAAHYNLKFALVIYVIVK